MTIDPGELVVLGASAPLALKLLGPTADYIGDELQSWAERRVENVKRIFDKAERRLGDQLDEPGSVPPRVLREILDGGSYWDDELGAEYFGGILASSRSQLSRDDRGASLAALVGRLSNYQLRCHYVLYSGALRHLRGTAQNLGWAHQRSKYGRFFIAERTWLTDMDCDAEERSASKDLISHSVGGLMREDLLGEKYGIGSRESLREVLGDHNRYPSSGIVFEVSILGIELFMAAHGTSESPLDAFVSTGNLATNSQIRVSGDVEPAAA